MSALCYYHETDFTTFWDLWTFSLHEVSLFLINYHIVFIISRCTQFHNRKIYHISYCHEKEELLFFIYFFGTGLSYSRKNIQLKDLRRRLTSRNNLVSVEKKFFDFWQKIQTIYPRNYLYRSRHFKSIHPTPL